MSFIIGTQVRPINMAAFSRVYVDMAKPKLLALGAVRVDGLERIAGENTGQFTSASEWESLHEGMKAFETFYSDPVVLAAMAANPFEPVGRIIGLVDATAGSMDADYAGLTAFNVTTPADAERAQAIADAGLEIGSPLGVKGIRSVTMYAAGAATGVVMGAAAIDNIDAWPQTSAAVAASPAVQEHFSAMGATVIERALVKMH